MAKPIFREDDREILAALRQRPFARTLVPWRLQQKNLQSLRRLLRERGAEFTVVKDVRTMSSELSSQRISG